MRQAMGSASRRKYIGAAAIRTDNISPIIFLFNMQVNFGMAQCPAAAIAGDLQGGYRDSFRFIHIFNSLLLKSPSH